MISAQYPLPGYIEDFLRFVRDFNIQMVVFFGPIKDIKSVRSFRNFFFEACFKKGNTISKWLLSVIAMSLDKQIICVFFNVSLQSSTWFPTKNQSKLLGNFTLKHVSSTHSPNITNNKLILQSQVWIFLTLIKVMFPANSLYC